MSLSNPIPTYTAEEIQTWLTSHIAELLGVEAAEIDIASAS